MHDRNGTPLHVGDTVTILARIERLSVTEDYCNVDLETIHGQRPDGAKRGLYALNTGLLTLVARAD
jgi:hypothetical protein